MEIRLLGTAAGGAFPQWNCRCKNCAAVRDGQHATLARSQSSVAVSADGRDWFLLNVSPDIRYQIESFPPLLAKKSARGTQIEGMLLTNADLDHVLGLFLLRENARPLAIHATSAVRRCLNHGLRLEEILGPYCGTRWHEPPADLSPLLLASNEPSGLMYAAIPLPGKPPRYFGKDTREESGYSIAYRITDVTTGGSLVYMPDLSPAAASMLAALQCDVLLLDGTFWADDEMEQTGVGHLTAGEMDHLPVGGGDGSLRRIAPLAIRHKIYVHINNTNPMLLDNSPQRNLVEEAGVLVGRDGMHFEI